MFIRVKSKPGSSGKSVQLVESIRQGRTVSQRIVRHIGVARTDAELAKLKELGEVMKLCVQRDQPSLIPQEDLAELAAEARKAEAKEGPGRDQNNKTGEFPVRGLRIRSEGMPPGNESSPESHSIFSPKVARIG